MVQPVGKAARREARSSRHPRNLPPPLIQRIATFLPCDSFFAYLRAFQSTHSLGDLRHFLTFVKAGRVNANDLWPELHLRSVDAANTKLYYRVAQFVSVVHIHDSVFNLDWLERVVPADKPVALQSWPYDLQVTLPLHEWGARLAKRMQVTHLSFAESDQSGGGGGDKMVALLPQLPWLRSLNLEELSDELLDDALAYVCNSKLTSVAMGTFSVPLMITAERALLLTIWLQRERVESLSLSHSSFEEDDHVATVHRFLVALGRSPLASLTLSDVSFGTVLAGLAEWPMQARCVKVVSTELSDDQAGVLFKGLGMGLTTNIHLDHVRLEYHGVLALGELIRLGGGLEALTIEGTRMEVDEWDVLARALARSKKLRELYLVDTFLRDTDVVQIANALVAAPDVRVVHIVGNPIQFAGAVALVQCLRYRRHPLDEFKLEGLAVSEAEEALLKSMLDGSPAVKRSSVRMNDVMHLAMQM